MNKQNFDHLTEEAEKKAEKRAKKKSRSMKVSGSSVKLLEKIIKDKANQA